MFLEMCDASVPFRYLVWDLGEKLHEWADL